MKESEDLNKAGSRRRFLQSAAAGGAWVALQTNGVAAEAAVAKMQPVSSHLPAERTLGKEFIYHASVFTKIDPALIQYAESLRFDTGLKEVRGLAVDKEDRIYVAGDQAIRVYSSAGKQLGEFDLKETVNCVSCGPGGLLYVGLKERVAVLDQDGKIVARWEGLGDKAVITSISASRDVVFVADAGQRQVWRFDAAGKKTGEIVRRDPAQKTAMFDVPSPFFEVALDGGLLWVVNPGQHRIEAYTLGGQAVSFWGVSSNAIGGFCGCCNPIHFVLLPDGRFITSEKGLPRVKIYSGKGELEAVVAGPEAFPELTANPRPPNICLALAVDSYGRVLVADAATHAVKIFTRFQEQGRVFGKA